MVDEYNTLLKTYRAKIDDLDDKIVDLLVAREQIITEVSNVKYTHNVPAILPKRVDEVKMRTAMRAKEQSIQSDYINQIYKNIIDVSCALENKIFDDKNTDEKNKK